MTTKSYPASPEPDLFDVLGQDHEIGGWTFDAWTDEVQQFVQHFGRPRMTTSAVWRAAWYTCENPTEFGWQLLTDV